MQSPLEAWARNAVSGLPLVPISPKFPAVSATRSDSGPLHRKGGRGPWRSRWTRARRRRGPVLKGAGRGRARARLPPGAAPFLARQDCCALPCRWRLAGIVGFYALTLGVSWQLGPGRLKVGEVQLTADDLTMKNPTLLRADQGWRPLRGAGQESDRRVQQGGADQADRRRRRPAAGNDVATKLKAKHGLLDNAKSELELYDGIEIDASNGMKARMSRAMVYSKEHRVVSKHPVDLSMPTGRVQGATMTMRTDTREATFVGDVKAHLVSTEQPGQPAPSTPGLRPRLRHPVDVTADQLYVNDFAKTALFMGKVVAVQGDSTLKAPELHIAYEGKAAADAMTRRLEPQQPARGLTPVASRGQGRRRRHDRRGPARNQRPGRVRRQGRHGAVHRRCAS